MSYRHYETECFVISLSGERGANRSAFLLSRELGPIWAHAQGLRRMQSKLRYSLQAPARTRVVLVKGKDIWRIVGAEDGVNYWMDFKDKKEHLSLINRLFSFLGKILVGDDKDERLFMIISGLTDYLNREDAKKENILGAELLSVARILHALGFLSFSEGEAVLKRSDIRDEDVLFAEKERKKLLSAVNVSLRAADL